MSSEYFEDLHINHVYRSREYPLTSEEIIRFASEWDPQPFHLDLETGKKSRMGSLCASGIHLVAIVGKLFGERESRMIILAGFGWEKVQFLAPARPGDRLVMELEPLTKRESRSDPKSGIVHIAIRLINQNSERVLSLEGTTLIAKRPDC